MSRFCVTRVGRHDALQMACSEVTGEPLTWETWAGAFRFTEMNGGNVTPFAALPDGTVNTAASETGE